MLRSTIMLSILFFVFINNIFAECKYCQTYCKDENNNSIERRVPASLFLWTWKACKSIESKWSKCAKKDSIATKYHKNNEVICLAEKDGTDTVLELDDYWLCSSSACIWEAAKILEAKQNIQKLQDEADRRQRKDQLEALEVSRKNSWWADDMSSENFTMSTTNLLWDNSLKSDNSIAKDTINTTLWTVIQKLMIALGSIALLIMTIWAWYTITYSWHDELLSKWKSIFNAWILSLVVALLAYYLVSLLRFILYS